MKTTLKRIPITIKPTPQAGTGCEISWDSRLFASTIPPNGGGIKKLVLPSRNPPHRWLLRPEAHLQQYSAHILNCLPENDARARPFAQGIIPDLSVDGTGRELGDQAKKAFGDQAFSLFDWKTLAPGKAYSETASTEFAVIANKRQVEVTKQYRTTAKHLDAMLGTPPDTIRPVETELNTYNSGAVVGLVEGAFGEMSEGVHCITSFIASELASHHLQFFALDPGMVRSIFLRRVRRSLGLKAHRGWAKLLLDRTRDLVQHPNQPRNTRTTDEDDAEAHAHCHQTHPPGRNGV
jgi:hypothetical protein